MFKDRKKKKASAAGVLKKGEWYEVELKEWAISAEPCEPLEEHATLMVLKHHLAIVQTPCSFPRM